MHARSYAVLLNPAAANRRAGRERARLRHLLARTGAPFELLQTRAPGHATELAREASASFDVVVAAGGDGTLQEVAAGLAGARPGVALGLLPLGTGNDFARMLGIPRVPERAVEALLASEPVVMDAGLARWREAEGGPWREGLFANAIGIGFDAYVAGRARGFKRLRGQGAYLAAVLSSLSAWAQPEVRIELDAGAEALAPDGTLGPLPEDGPFYRGPLFLASVNNGPSVGGGFRLTPHARADDGRLDLCLVAGPLSVARTLRLLPRAMRGRHLAEPEVASARLAALRLRAEAGLPIHADGEIFTRGALEVVVEVRPGALLVLRPAGGAPAETRTPRSVPDLLS